MVSNTLENVREDEDPLEIVNAALQKSELHGILLKPYDLKLSVFNGIALFSQFPFYYCPDLNLHRLICGQIHLNINRLALLKSD